MKKCLYIYEGKEDIFTEKVELSNDELNDKGVMALGVITSNEDLAAYLEQNANKLSPGSLEKTMKQWNHFKEIEKNIDELRLSDIDNYEKYSKPMDLIGQPIYNYHNDEGNSIINCPLNNIIIPLALKPNGKVLVIKCDLDIGFDKKIFLEEIENKQEYLLIDNYLLDAIESQERACLSFRWNKVENYLEMYPEAVEQAIHYFSNLE